MTVWLKHNDRIHGVVSFQLDVIPKRKTVNRHVWVARCVQMGDSDIEKIKGSRELGRRSPMVYDLVDLEVEVLDPGSENRIRSRGLSCSPTFVDTTDMHTIFLVARGENYGLQAVCAMMLRL